MMKKFISILLVFAAIICISTNLFSQITITDDGSGTGTTTWTNDNTYVLDGFVFVNDGDVLTIDPGTIIKGKAGSGADASALVVARGGQIFANGTSDSPIIFTFENDALDGSTPYNIRGQWGGVIILGDAQLNSTPGETQIEGIPDTESRGRYGGNDDMDNSGSMSYVSIRHGGTDIGAGNEINGLTLGGVGSNSNFDHIEVISNADDGVEFFGGTASIKYVLTAFCGDDSFDYDEGWRGYGQYWCTIQEEGEGDRGGEHDGGTDPEDGMPYAHPVIYNATYIGQGVTAGKRALTLRDNAAGEYHNSIFYGWGKGFDVENLASGEDSYARLTNDEIVFEGNVFDQCTAEGLNATSSDLFKISMGSGWSSESDSTEAANNSSSVFQATFDENDNSVASTGINNTIIQGAGLLNLIPTAELSVNSSSELEWFDETRYPGAFDPNLECTWLDGWSMLSEREFISCDASNIDEAIKSEFSIFPNPTNGEFSITFESEAQNASVNIIDLNGKLVYNNTRNVSAGEIVNISLLNLPEGMYLVNILSDNQTQYSKLIIE